MAKSFKLRISRVISNTFQSCRSKDPSTLPQDPVPSYFRFSPVNTKLLAVDHLPQLTTPRPPTEPTQHCRSSFRRHVSSAFISVGCGFTSSKTAAIKDSDDHRSRSTQEFSWQEEEKWHVVAKICDENNQNPRKKIYNSSASGDSDNDDVLALPPPPPPPPPHPSKKKRRGKKKKTPARLRVSTSSAESGIFSSEGGELIFDDDDDDGGEEQESLETETLISSSRSFSTDSSTEFNPHLEPIRETPIRHKRSKKKAKKHLKRSVSRTIYRPSSVSSAAENESPARLSVFKKLIPCSVDGKVKESFAIVKKSEDPYEDFKRSMMEMILEKQMFEEKDLEQLLQCFLSLNARHYHGLIIEVFAEIWEAMFCASDRSSSRHRRPVNSRNLRV